MPAEPLSAEERRVLDVLMEHGRPPAERTEERISQAAALEVRTVRDALRSLEERAPALAQSEVDARLGDRIWASTVAALEVDD